MIRCLFTREVFMSADMDFTLTGSGIPNEYLYGKDNQVAAKRLHSSAANLVANTLTYDGGDLSGALRSVIDDAAGILRTVQSGRESPYKFLDSKVVTVEVDVLAKDIKNVVDVVKNTFATKAGKDRWGENSGTFIESRSKELLEIATDLEKAAQEYAAKNK